MGSNTYAATDITPLSSLEAIRKRPSMYYDLADPLLGSKLMLQALMFPLELGIKAQVILTSEISGTVAWGKALSTDVVGNTGIRRAEAIIAQLFAGGSEGVKPPTVAENLFEGLTGQMAVVNAACDTFEVTINDAKGEWGQRFVKGAPVDTFRQMNETSVGDYTFMEIKLDTEFFKEAGAGEVKIDSRFVQSWCGDQEVPIEVVLWT